MKRKTEQVRFWLNRSMRRVRLKPRRFSWRAGGAIAYLPIFPIPELSRFAFPGDRRQSPLASDSARPFAHSASRCFQSNMSELSSLTSHRRTSSGPTGSHQGGKRQHTDHRAQDVHVAGRYFRPWISQI